MNNIYDTITEAPKDPILGLTEEFKSDKNPKKVNLSVGVYQDDNSKTPTFESVTLAEKKLIDINSSKTYKPIDGDSIFLRETLKLVLGESLYSKFISNTFGFNTPGGTGALKLASDFLYNFSSKSKVWLSNPTWPNHGPVFNSSGFEIKNYDYFDKNNNKIDFKKMIDSISSIPENDIIVLHGCCHNPTGADMNKDQWAEITKLIKKKNLITVCDFAYQGLGDGVEEDAAGVRNLINELDNLIICSSYSKNFGLYSERVGCLIYHTKNLNNYSAVQSNFKKVARTIYSNPPSHGSDIVKTILSDDFLRKIWMENLDNAKNRIIDMRNSLITNLIYENCSRNFDFIANQKGMFSFTGLTENEVAQLKEKFSIYIVKSGRINVAGITSSNVKYIAKAISGVI
ncbi:MAG: aspartate/tyrosine/aromatic aminotransferase [Chloroflexi bacterium]|nr:aspartate/tyrosine/aromatic aminotransferase [Chloroflexota bacterium]